MLPKDSSERNWINVNPKNPCPVCHKDGWCSVSTDGRTVTCRRIEQGSQNTCRDKNGELYYVHQLDSGAATQPPRPDAELTQDEQEARHEIYSRLLDLLPLRNAHLEELARRGLEVTREDNPRAYASLAGDGRSALERLAEEGYADRFPLVPGLVYNGRTWSIAGPRGLLIPVRDANGKITAVMVRPDKRKGPKYLYLTSKKSDGPGPGAPVHVPLPSDPGGVVRVTEGVLKADAATHLGEILTIGLPGVGSWRKALETLDRLDPDTVVVAFDADARTNPTVARNLAEFFAALQGSGREIYLETWDPADGKGIDDVLLAGKPTQTLQGEEAESSLKEILEQAGVTLDEADRAAGLPRVITGGRQRREIVADAAAVLASTNSPPTVFVRNHEMVEVLTSESGPSVRPLTEASLYDRLINAADWYDGKETVPSRPPADVVKCLIVSPPAALPALQAAISYPVFGRCGSLIAADGYHPDDRLFLQNLPGLSVRAIPPCPTAQDIKAARDLILYDLLGDFPFESPADLAHAMAAALLPYVRRMIDGPTPLHLITAPEKGTGKTLLAGVLSQLATGSPCEARALPHSGDEVRKMITAELIAGRPVVLLDNVTSADSSALAAALTSAWWTDRLLGKSEKVTVQNRAMWLMTANNPHYSVEIARRSVRIRLDAAQEQPWRREKFKHPHLSEWVHESRGDLVAAALTLIQAWVAAGKPRSAATLGSFDQWSAVMGGILEVAGIPGFLENLDTLYDEADDEIPAWRSFVAAWWDKFRDGPCRANQLADLLGSCELMRELLDSRHGGQSPASKLGTLLKGADGRVFAGVRVVRSKDRHAKSHTFRLELVDSDARQVSESPADSPAAASATPTTAVEVRPAQAEGAAGTHDPEPLAADASPDPQHLPPPDQGNGLDWE